MKRQGWLVMGCMAMLLGTTWLASAGQPAIGEAPAEMQRLNPLVGEWRWRATLERNGQEQEVGQGRDIVAVVAKGAALRLTSAGLEFGMATESEALIGWDQQAERHWVFQVSNLHQAPRVQPATYDAEAHALIMEPTEATGLDGQPAVIKTHMTLPKDGAADAWQVVVDFETPAGERTARLVYHYERVEP